MYYITFQNDMQPELSGEFEIGAFIMEKFRVGIIGATGMVGQRFVLLTANHPWFTPVVLAASAHSEARPTRRRSKENGIWLNQFRKASNP